ncbi:MAG: DUF1848 family protein [Spirochaetes bacterium]|nr:DUF1848 family protein [Spirochaetota bacterium]
MRRDSTGGRPAVITFSRRTDPAFFMDWFMDKVGQGWCMVPNPFSGKPYRVGLSPGEVLLLTFWTRDPLAVAARLGSLIEAGYRTAFFVTCTGYPRWLEAAAPDPERVRRGLAALRAMLPPRALWWRYDPIIVTGTLTPQWHRDNFTRLCDTLWAGNTGRVIVSLAHIDGPYESIRRRLVRLCQSRGDPLDMPGYNAFIELAAALRDTAAARGIELEVCCSPLIREAHRGRIRQEGCLAERYIAPLVDSMPPLRRRGTRRGSDSLGYAPCGCLESVDIGANGTCRHGCVYCYANRHGTLAGPIPPASPWLSPRDIGEAAP